MLRDELGDFSSVVCLKAIITGMEDMLGDQATAIALTNAGKIRGKEVVTSLGIDQSVSLDALARKLDDVLGANGTRLCVIDGIEQDGDALLVRTRETVCSAGEADGSPRKCTYTLGVVWGALQAVRGDKLRGTHVASVLRGDTHDVFRYVPL